jgi:hypothetical protein
LDFFISHDRVDSAEGQMATSAINGSVLPRRHDRAGGLGALLLWSDGALSDQGGLAWTHEIDVSIEFAMTIIPTNFSDTLNALPSELNRLGLPNTFLGTSCTWPSSPGWPTLSAIPTRWRTGGRKVRGLLSCGLAAGHRGQVRQADHASASAAIVNS